MVLSQNPATGELAYRPVLDTTAGPPTGFVVLKFGGETITATLGHRFWVEGRGWEMAKFLTTGATIRGLHGPVDVTSSAAVNKDQEGEAYNLVVEEFGTYFVGKSRLLVHDITCPQPVAPAMRQKAAEKPAEQSLAGN